jgi:hypothetical protein
VILPILLISGGIAALIVLALADADGPVPDHRPDLPPAPGSTRYRKVDEILSELRKAAEASGIPLGLLVGWVAKESGGRLDEVTRFDERGYFQLMPAESASLGIDHARLSTDPVYSINAGLLLIGKYMRAVDALGIAPRGSTYYWMLVKLAHTMGSGAMNQIVALARAAGSAGSWSALEDYAVAHDAELLSATRHSPKKWFPLVDAVLATGEPFGFGSGGPSIVGSGPAFADIVDPLDCLPRS